MAKQAEAGGTQPGLGEDHGGKSPCVTCREPISSEAKKCVHCDSFQDWRRTLGMSSSVLALLVALVSVLSFAVPTAARFMEKDESNIMVSLQGVQGSNIYFLASNSGNKPGSVGNAVLEFWYGETRTTLPLYRTDKPPLLEPGASIQLSYTLARDQQQAIPRAVIQSIDLDGNQQDAPQSSGARFDIQTIEFDGSTKKFSFPMAFDELNRSTAYMDPRCIGAREALQRGGLSQSEAQFLQANCPGS